MSSRRQVHTRTIRADVFVRDDGLWDLEAEMLDTKSADFPLATGVRLAGTPIHRMRLTITIDTQFDIVDAVVRSLEHPYPEHCGEVEPAYRALIGLNLMKNFKRAVRERLGGTRGCTHMTELTDVLPTAAVQAFAGVVLQNRDTGEDQAAERPFQLDRCHALRVDGPAVARFYPRWFRPAPHDSTEETAERHS